MDWINDLTLQDVLIGFLILLVMFVGVQLNRIEKQNASLWGMIREIRDKTRL